MTKKIHIQETKPCGTNGGTCLKDKYITRNLNTIVENEVDGFYLYQNQINLPSGKYDFKAAVQGESNMFKAVLFDPRNECIVTEGTVGIKSIDNTSCINGYFEVKPEDTVDGVKRFEIRHASNETVYNHGLGKAFGHDTEVYIDVKIEKIED